MHSEAIRNELMAICQKHGGMLRPEDVVEEAEVEASPLHSWFTWEDDEAARLYRVWQARQLIRTTVVTMPNSTEPVRVFVSMQDDRQEEGGGYRQLADVMWNDELRERMLAEALREMELFAQKYSLLQELVPVFEAMARTRRAARHKANPASVKHARLALATVTA